MISVEFGGWRKRRGQAVYEPKLDRPYVVALADGGSGYSATLAGEHPELLHVVLPDGCTDKQALKAAQRVCEEHWVGKSGALQWQHNEETEDWTAPGPGDGTYVVEQESDGPDGGVWLAAIGSQALNDSDSAEAAKAVCQRHRDTELKWRVATIGHDTWRATSPLLAPSEDYSCSLVTELPWPAWQAEHLSEAIGEPAETLEEAQRVCQEHHREQAAAEEQDGDEPAADGEPAAEGGPEKGEWTIPVKLTEAEAAAKGRLLGELMVSLGQETLAIARAKEAAKCAVKAAEAEIERLNEQALPIAEQLDAGEEHRLVLCHRHKDDRLGEVWYTDCDTGEELHRHAVAKGEQLGCWGETAPPDKPPEPEPEPEPEEAPPDDEQPDEPAPAPLPADRDLTRKDFRKINTVGDEGGIRYIAGSVETEHYEIGKSKVGLYEVSFFCAGVGKRPLPGEHRRLKDAVAEASADNRKRLRWPGDPESKVLLDSTACYQLAQCVSGLWAPGYVGGLDDDGEELSVDALELLDARAVCQAHKDGGGS